MKLRLLLIVLLLSTAHAQTRETFVSGKATRVEYVYVPEQLKADVAAPVLVLLHGSFGNGENILREWIDVANREGIVLIAPDASDRMNWRLRQDSPQFLNDAINAVAAKQAIDWKRLYVFGHSGGAVYTLMLAMLESEYFAAAALHAGSWRQKKEYDAMKLAKRKIPVALFIGDKDEYFPLRTVQDTAKALEQAGHPTMLEVIPRHTHNYRDVSADVNVKAWDFLKARTLEENPKLQLYN
jgi:poly(3-hydroxybutyrate) depolymerase